MKQLLKIWNEVPCVEMPWYHRFWVETILGLWWCCCAMAGGAIAMVMLITAPVWFPIWICCHKE